MAKKRNTPRSAKLAFELPAPELVVVAHPQAGLRVRPDALTAESADTGPIEAALGESASLVPVFGSTEERLHDQATAELTEVRPPDLSVFYRVEAPPEDLERLASELVQADAIETAYIKPPAEP